MPETLAIRVVELTGGRLIHLIQAVKTHFVNSTLSEDLQMEEIKKFLYAKNIDGPLSSLKSNSVIGEKIVRYILSNGATSPLELRDAFEDDEAILKAIECLVEANLFRYTADGLLSWHSRIVCCAQFNICWV